VACACEDGCLNADFLIVPCDKCLGLQVVLEILNARLMDIRDWWDAGALAARGFTAAEVGRLVSALFEATELRQRTLDHLAATAQAHAMDET